MIVKTLVFVTILEVQITYVTSLETFDRELQYCCPMSTDNLSLLVDEYVCVGVYNERRNLNIDCDEGKDIKIVEYSTFNISNVNLKKFCFVTEVNEDVQFLAVCMEKLPTQWILDLPYYCKSLSIIYLCMTLYGYARIETLKRPDDVPFVIFTGFVMVAIMSDVVQFILKRYFELEMNYKILIYTQYYTYIGSFIWMNIILLYQLRENM